jgi:hypothetical protein
MADRVRVFSRAGVFVRDILGYVGSQGIRAVNADGSMQTGDADYTDGVLTEFTIVNGVRIGQGHDGGGIAAETPIGVKRTLLAGAIYFVRANYDPTLRAYAIYGFDARQGYRIRCTQDALLAAPIDGPTPQPTSTPPPVPNSGPTVPTSGTPNPPRPEPIPMADLPNHADVYAAAINAQPDLLAKMRAIYNAVQDQDHWTQAEQDAHVAVRQVLHRYGAYAVYQVDPDYGLLKKESGAHGERPQDHAKYALGMLMHRPTRRLVQALSDTGPVWNEYPATDTRTADFWIQPLPEGDSVPAPQPDPTPDPTPEPPPADPPSQPPHDQSATEVMVSLLLDRVEKLEARIKTLELPRKVSTSRVWGHSHEIELP